MTDVLLLLALMFILGAILVILHFINEPSIRVTLTWQEECLISLIDIFLNILIQ